MSHFTTIETRIRDLTALAAACRELGLELVSDSTARGYAGQTLHGERVIRLKGPYDIAVNPGEDGTYVLSTDWWDGHAERDVGTGFGKLLQRYGVCRTQAEARRKGYTVSRRTLGDGSIKLTIGGLR